MNKIKVMMYNTKNEKPVKDKNAVRLSQDIQIPINNLDGVRWLAVGNPSSGKTWLGGIVFDQFVNSTVIDPTGKFIKTIEKQADESGYPENFFNWKTYKLEEKEKGFPTFKMNTRDLHERAINAIFPKTEQSKSQAIQRQLLHKFFGKDDKTYAELKNLCEELGIQHILNDLNLILDKNDEAPSIDVLMRGKKVIDIEGISINQKALGVYLQSMIGYKSDMGEEWSQRIENFMMIGFDEAQAYCRYNTPLGNANADIIGQARKYGLGSLAMGAGYNNIHIDIRLKWNMVFVFSSPGLAKHYAKEGIEIDSTDFENLEDYASFVYSENGDFTGVRGKDILLPDLSYLHERYGKEIVAIEKDKTVYKFSKFKFL